MRNSARFLTRRIASTAGRMTSAMPYGRWWTVGSVGGWWIWGCVLTVDDPPWPSNRKVAMMRCRVDVGLAVNRLGLECRLSSERMAVFWRLFRGVGGSELRERFRERGEETAEKAVEVVVLGETEKRCQGKWGLCKTLLFGMDNSLPFYMVHSVAPPPLRRQLLRHGRH